MRVVVPPVEAVPLDVGWVELVVGGEVVEVTGADAEVVGTGGIGLGSGRSPATANTPTSAPRWLVILR